MAEETSLKACGYVIGSPLGDLSVVFSERGLLSISLMRGPGEMNYPYSGLHDRGCDERLSAVKTYLSDYFFCRDPGMNDIVLDMEGISPFRRSAYNELLMVPFGELVTYGELARRIGSPKGARAVGQAMNRNPFLIVVPCHRVVATAEGGGYSIGGFGAGLDAKRLLLRLEGHDPGHVQGI